MWKCMLCLSEDLKLASCNHVFCEPCPVVAARCGRSANGVPPPVHARTLRLFGEDSPFCPLPVSASQPRIAAMCPPFSRVLYLYKKHTCGIYKYTVYPYTYSVYLSFYSVYLLVSKYILKRSHTYSAYLLIRIQCILYICRNMRDILLKGYFPSINNYHRALNAPARAGGRQQWGRRRGATTASSWRGPPTPRRCSAAQISP